MRSRPLVTAAEKTVGVVWNGRLPRAVPYCTNKGQDQLRTSDRSDVPDRNEGPSSPKQVPLRVDLAC
jgi:hypothetical protein